MQNEGVIANLRGVGLKAKNNRKFLFLGKIEFWQSFSRRTPIDPILEMKLIVRPFSRGVDHWSSFKYIGDVDLGRGWCPPYSYFPLPRGDVFRSFEHGYSKKNYIRKKLEGMTQLLNAKWGRHREFEGGGVGLIAKINGKILFLGKINFWQSFLSFTPIDPILERKLIVRPFCRGVEHGFSFKDIGDVSLGRGWCPPYSCFPLPRGDVFGSFAHG